MINVPHCFKHILALPEIAARVALPLTKLQSMHMQPAPLRWYRPGAIAHEGERRIAQAILHHVQHQHFRKAYALTFHSFIH